MKKQIDPLGAVIDEIGALEAELGPFKAKATRLEELKASVRKFYAGEPSQATFEVRGARFLTSVGPMGPQRFVKCSTLFKLVGPLAFLKLCTVTLKALESLGKPNVVLASIDTADDGPRTLKTYALPTIAKAA